jgi:hypothetical protein
VRHAFRLLLLIALMLAGLFEPVSAASGPKSFRNDWCIQGFEGLYDDAALRVAKNHLFREAEVSPTFETLSTRNFDLASTPERVEFAHIQNLRELDRLEEAAGLGYFKAFEGRLGSKRVFAKVSFLKPGDTRAGMRVIEHLRNETAWVRRLSDLGIGPKFQGLGFHEGRYALVTEFVDGIHYTNQVSDIPETFKPTKQLIESLENIARVFEREGIKPMDLQMRITADRAYVVDPEFFSPAGRRGDVMNAQDEIQTLIDHLRARMK